MSKDDKKSKGVDQSNHAAGSTAAEDEQLSLWFVKLWARDETPERVELWQMFGRNKDARGEMIHHEDFKQAGKLNAEQANKLANEILAAAQNDCDSVRKESWYQIAVIDRNRRASPLVRRVGPVQPKRTYAIAKSGDGIEAGDDEDTSLKHLELNRVKMNLDEGRWGMQRNDRVLGDLLMLYRDSLLEERAHSQRLQGQVMDLFQKNQEEADRRVQRDIMLEKEKFKFGLMKEGIRGARNLLPGIFGGDTSASAGPSDGNGHASVTRGNGNGGEAASAVASATHGPSAERTCVDNFLNDVSEDDLNIKLFGDFEQRNGNLVQLTPGIFSFEQFKVLAQVRTGRLPPSALDPLMPKSGHELSITEDQIKQASDAGVTEGMAMAIFQLIGLRQRAREAEAAARIPTPTSTVSPTA